LYGATVGYSDQAGRLVEQCDGGARKSALIALVGRPFVAAANPETGPSVLWFAAIQGIKGKPDLAGLAPQDCFIPA